MNFTDWWDNYDVHAQARKIRRLLHDPARLRNYFYALRPLEGLKVERSIEVGCGSGANSALLQILGQVRHVTLVDPEQGALRVAQELFADLCLPKPAMFRELKHFITHYDLALSGGVLEHYSPTEQARLVADLCRLAHRVQIDVPVATGWYWLVRFLRAGKGLPAETPLRVGSLEAMLGAEGMVVTRTEMHGCIDSAWPRKWPARWGVTAVSLLAERRVDRVALLPPMSPGMWEAAEQVPDAQVEFLELTFHPPRYQSNRPNVHIHGTFSHPDPRVQARLDEVWNSPGAVWMPESVRSGMSAEENYRLRVLGEFPSIERLNPALPRLDPRDPGDATATASSEPDGDWMMDYRVSFSRTTGRSNTSPKPSPRLLLSIMHELQSAIAALWDTDEEDRITNPCPKCGLPAWECQDDTHPMHPNDLRIKAIQPKIEAKTGKSLRRKEKAARRKAKASPPVAGIEWTDEKGRYHRLEDSYLAEAGLVSVDRHAPHADPSQEHGGGGEWIGDEFRVRPGRYLKSHGGLMMSKPLAQKDRSMFLEMCRRLDRAEGWDYDGRTRPADPQPNQIVLRDPPRTDPYVVGQNGWWGNGLIVGAPPPLRIIPYDTTA